MRISNTQNNRSFRGLNIAKVTRKEDMKRVIEPCLKELRELAKKATIEIESSSVMQRFEHFQTQKPVLNILVIPFDTLNAKSAISRYSMLLTPKNIKNRTLFKLVKDSV